MCPWEASWEAHSCCKNSYELFVSLSRFLAADVLPKSLEKNQLKSKKWSEVFSLTSILRTKLEISADTVGVTELLLGMYGSFFSSPSAQQVFLLVSALGAAGQGHIKTSVAVESKSRSPHFQMTQLEQKQYFWLVLACYSSHSFLLH